jgi:putative hemin transport protein
MMALTRNDSVVHEKTGVYTRVSGEAGIGMVLGRDIDLRLFLAQWHAGFAVMEVGPSPSAPSRRSLQFFNAHGRAIHKVFAREATDLAALEAVISRFADPLATTSFGVEAEPWIAPAGCEGIDAGSFLAQWAQTQDTHEFFGLIRRFGLQRQQAFRLAEGRFAWRLAPVAVSELLHGAARARTPIMVFVGSGGCIQIHTGLVHRIEALQGQGGEWLNVLDPGFNLHLRTDHIAEVWHVEKPTADGLVTSVEVFSARGELMAMFFGERKPGQPELVAWRALVAQLPSLMGLAV